MTFLEELDAIKVKINRWQEKDGYDEMYGMLDYQGKTVIDIGAELGSTAQYFFAKGASRVIAYEINPVLRNELIENYKDDDRVEVHAAWNGKELPAADVLKMDCETCEYLLTESELQRFPQWAIGVHRPRRNMPKVLAFEEMLRRNGGRMIADFGFERVYIKT